MQSSDGNLVLYHAGKALWATGAMGPGTRAVMQGDGNLVLYNGSTARWSSTTDGFSGAVLQLQDDGNLVIYQGSHPIWDWSAGYLGDALEPGLTLNPGEELLSPNHQYRLVMQGDGNLVLYNGASALWSTRTNGDAGAHAVMQGDGNLVVYLGATPKWNSQTDGFSGAALVLQDDSNLVIYRGATPVWDRAHGLLGGGTTGGGVSEGEWPGTSGPVAAHEKYGYPYPNAPECTHGGACILDAWRFYQGQCTSWVAYRLNQLNQIGFTDYYGGHQWGDAASWGSVAVSEGIAVNGTPALGSVAWYASGHVAYVEEVKSPTAVVISEMNYDYENGFRVRTITTSSGWPSGFIHIHDR
ncbi:MAG TPA: CHAP domain-containing protein [Solirubrobacterales bacterium]